MTYSNGAVYDGQWRKDQRYWKKDYLKHGRGTYTTQVETFTKEIG